VQGKIGETRCYRSLCSLISAGLSYTFTLALLAHFGWAFIYLYARFARSFRLGFSLISVACLGYLGDISQSFTGSFLSLSNSFFDLFDALCHSFGFLSPYKY
jgi:hypothetical protein